MMEPPPQPSSRPAFLGLDTRYKKTIFWAYVASWSIQGILIHGARVLPEKNDIVDDNNLDNGRRLNSNNGLSYNVTAMVVVVCLIKLVVSLFLLYKNDYDGNNAKSILPEGWMKVFALYFIPAGLYAVYNNLTHICLSYINPGKYFIVLQLRLLVTGVIFQMVFKKQISRQKWVALSLITFGCILKELPMFLQGVPTPLSVYALLSVQILSSTAAGVATEYLLKDYKKMGVNIQNIFMYIASAVIQTVVFCLFGGNNSDSNSTAIPFSIHAFFSILMNPHLLLIALNGAANGLLTGYLLSCLTSVHKAIAAAIEIGFTALLSWLFFGSDFGIFTISSVVVVMTGVYLYSGYTLNQLKALVTGTSQKAGEAKSSLNLQETNDDDEAETTGLMMTNKNVEGNKGGV
jgi:UDP-sugar transporter A1/2/3